MKLKLKTRTKLPAALVGRTGIAVAKAGLTYNLDLDYSRLVQTSQFDPVNGLFAVWNKQTGVWNTINPAGLTSGSFQSVNAASATIADGTSLLAIQRAAPSATSLTLPLLANQGGKPIVILDWSTSVTSHAITITPAGGLGTTIMKAANWTINSSASQAAAVVLYPSLDLNSWYIAPLSNFLQAGTGAVPRTFQDKVREVVSVNDFGASGSTQNTTGTITSGTTTLTLASALDFNNGQGICVNHAGAAFATNPPTALTVTPTGTAGTTTYTYTIASLDANGGVGAAIANVSTTTGNATLSATNFNALSWAAASGGAALYAVYGRAAGSLTLLGITGSTTFKDTGAAAIAAPDWVPSAPQGVALADSLVTTVSSGAGTTTLTLANAATTTATSQSVFHDDTAAIQAAITSLSGTGGVINLPGAVYRTSSAIIISIGGVTLRGGGRFTATIKTTSPTADIIRINVGGGSLTGIGIENLVLDASVVKTAGVCINSVATNLGSLFFSSFRNIQTTANTFAGISINGGFFLNLHDIVILGVGADSFGISLAGLNSSTVVGNVILTDINVNSNATPGTISRGVYISDFAEGIYGSRLILENRGLNQDLYIANPSANNLNAPKNLWFNQLIADGASSVGVFCEFARTLRLSNSWSTTSLGRGAIFSDGVDIELSGHAAINNATDGILVAAPVKQFRYLGGVVDSNSQGAPNTSHGISIAANTTDFTIANVDFIRNGSSATHSSDINIAAGTSNKYIITGNRMYGGTNSLTDGGTGTSKTIDGNIGTTAIPSITPQTQTAPVYKTNASPATAWGLDSTGSSITVANNATADFAAGAGLIVITDTTSGQTAAYLVSGGTPVLVSSTGTLFVAGAPAAGKVGIEWNTSTAYRINNKQGASLTFNVAMLRTKTTA